MGKQGPVPKTSPWDVAVDSFVSPLTPRPGKQGTIDSGFWKMAGFEIGKKHDLFQKKDGEDQGGLL